MDASGITFYDVFAMEMIGLTVVVTVFMAVTVLFQYYRNVELKLSGAIILTTVVVAIIATKRWEAEIWRVAVYSIGAMFLSATIFAVVLTGINVAVERFRD